VEKLIDQETVMVPAGRKSPATLQSAVAVELPDQFVWTGSLASATGSEVNTVRRKRIPSAATLRLPIKRRTNGARRDITFTLVGADHNSVRRGRESPFLSILVPVIGCMWTSFPSSPRAQPQL
jgi:hypothetical protein